MKKLLLLFSIPMILFSCAKEGEKALDNKDQENKDLVPKEVIKEMVEGELAKGEIFYWTEQTDQVIYSAGMHSDQIFSIGYTTSKDFDIVNEIHKIDLQSSGWSTAKQKVVDEIFANESLKKGTKLEDIMPFEDVEEHFPQIIVKLGNLQTIEALRAHPNVRFVEPIGFNFEDDIAKQRSSSGCGNSPNYNINSADYTTVAPSAKVPWNFYDHNIPSAWSFSTGDNIRVAILDTGAGNAQDNLGSNFNSGYSSGRNIQKYSTHYSGSWWWKTLDSPHDQCGHGTSMAGLAGAPRSNDGNATGVAYNSNVMTIRAVQDVVISSSNERDGVKNALYLAGSRSDVKVISMSIGTPFYSSTVADGVYYAYNQGKLMVAAAGTSLSWTSWYPVIFPATMSQTVAVTGVKDSPNLVKCAVCHSGSQVDFVINMERAVNDDRHSLALALTSNQPSYIGGSSCGTATFAGIATLVWAENPSASRATVMSALKNASQFYPARSSNFGWGRIDALDAVSNI